ncbi:MAG: YcdB/YcdC domain-containing protein, partial [Desulfurispora sp.]|uniref:YcdB/YcdC domain-containing protein n=1 Tax=Desulfurispora sp. TaxID=3014275 RepID=UPI00404B2711
AAPADGRAGVQVETAAGAVQASPANDGDLMSEERAVQIVKEKFPGWDWSTAQFNTYLDQQISGRAYWNIDANWQKAGRPWTSQHCHFRLDAVSGQVVSFYLQPARSGEPAEPVSRQQALVLAEKELKRHLPEKAGQLKLQENEPVYPPPGRWPERQLNTTYLFRWVRVVEGVPLEADYVHIGIDALTGRVQSMDSNWHSDLDLPAARPRLSEREAREKMAAKLGLAYFMLAPGDGQKSTVPRLVYTLKEQGPQFLDAGSGAFLDWQGQQLKQSGEEKWPSGSGEYRPPARHLTPAQGLELARQIFAALGGQGRVQRTGVSRERSYEWEQDYPVWEYGLFAGQNAAEQKGSLRLRPDTGRVLNLYLYPDYPGDAAGKGGGGTLERAAAVAAVRQFLEKTFPGLSGSLALQPEYPTYTPPDAPEREVRLVRLVNGIPFYQDFVEVAVNRQGRVVRFYMRWSELDFPAVPAEKLLTAEKARRLWQDAAEVPLQYQLFEPYPGKEAAGKQKIGLVYALRRSGLVDALTGQVLDYDGRPFRSGKDVPPYNWQGSKSALYLELLAGSGLLPAPEQFKLDEPLTRQQGLELVLACYPYYYPEKASAEAYFQDVAAGHPAFAAARQAVDAGILDKGGLLRPEAPLDRQTLALWLAGAAGYKEVAELPVQIEISPYPGDIQDLLPQTRNCLALVVASGLLPADEGKFYPGRTVTWEEIAPAVVKLAGKVRDKANW